MASSIESPSGAKNSPAFQQSSRSLIGLLASILIPLAIWFAPLNLDPTAKHAMAVASFMIVAWIAAVIPHAITGMIGCYLFWILKIAKFEDAFGGFADQTPWFLFGAILFGMMATKSGLARRIAIVILRRTGSGYSRLLLGMIFTSFVLTFLVPSGIACVVIMAAVALGLMEVFGLGKGSNVGRGIFVTLTYTAGTFDKIVLAGPAAILGRGLIEKGTGAHLYWSLWLLAFFPVRPGRDFRDLARGPLALSSGKRSAGRQHGLSGARIGKAGRVDLSREKIPLFHANCHKPVGHRLATPHLTGRDWTWSRLARGNPWHWAFSKRRTSGG